jgi:hypothetical protein
MAAALGPAPVAALDLSRLSRKAADVVAACCAQLGVAWRQWSSAHGEPHQGTVVVSALRWGEREVPEQLLESAGSAERRAPLLLLCAEPMVAPSVDLHQGLVTLAGSPLAPDRLLGELRVAFVRALGEGIALPHPNGAELLTPSFWLASASAEGARLPLVRDEGEGFAALVTFSQSPEWGPGVLADLGALLEEREAEPELIAALGNQAGLLRLDPVAREWRIFWPSSSPLYFHSSTRLPRVVDLSAASDSCRTFHRLGASRGDALVALSTAAPARFPGMAALGGGAPAFMHRAAASLASADAEWAVFYAEARA